MYNHISERYHVSHLSGILDQAIANNVNDVEKYQCKSVDVDRTVVSRLEKLMVIVRRQHSTPPWEDLLQMLLSMLMTRESIVETFCDVIANITRNFKMLKVYHLLTMYTMLVDTVSLYVQEKQYTDVLQDLQKLHIFIISKSNVSVLANMLSMIE